jgi:hypothetical protein
MVARGLTPTSESAIWRPMANQALIPERFFAELNKLGPAVVRQRLAAGAWGKAGQKVKLARLWLADNDRRKPAAEPARQARQGSDPFPTPQEAVRRSAAAAEESADLAESAYAIAKDANFRAALALAVAAASLIVHLMLAFLRPS